MTSLLYRRGGTVSTGGSGSIVQPFFSDSFAGGQRNPANGFTWAPPNDESRVQVVTFDGRSCLRFRFGPDAVGADSAAEQRFNLGRNLQEVWIEYNLHIPSNYELRADFPANNKFFSLWPVNYSASVAGGWPVNETYVVTEFERNGTNTSFARMLGLGDRLYNDSNFFIRGGNAIQNSNFISAARAGQWWRIRLHYRLASGPGQTDGVWEGWIGDELMWRSRTDWEFWSTGGLNFVEKGFFMGAANSGYTQQTDFHVDAPKFYDQNPGWEGQT